MKHLKIYLVEDLGRPLDLAFLKGWTVNFELFWFDINFSRIKLDWLSKYSLFKRRIDSKYRLSYGAI